MAKAAAKKKPQSTEKTIVKPSVTFAGGKSHVLDILLKENDAPILKSVGYARISGNGLGNYVAYVITSQADKILKIEVEEPNLKAIAEEFAKISFVNNFMSGDM